LDVFGRVIGRHQSKKRDEVERLAELERLRTKAILCRRQKELEAKLVEDETAKRIEEMVAKRVEEELEKRKDEIEAEVLRRVEEAKRIMEKQMLAEMERRRISELEEQKRKEVTFIHAVAYVLFYLIWKAFRIGIVLCLRTRLKIGLVLWGAF